MQMATLQGEVCVCVGGAEVQQQTGRRAGREPASHITKVYIAGRLEEVNAQHLKAFNTTESHTQFNLERFNWECFKSVI